MNSMWAKAGKTAVILSLAVWIPAAAYAFGGYWGGGKPMGPPQEAVDACKDLSEGDMVQFTTPRGDTVTGVCRELREGLAAVPAGRFRGRHRGTGPEDRTARMVRRLGLTEEQREQVQAILESERKTAAPLRQQLAETRKKMREAALAEPFDESAIRRLAERRSEMRVELDISRARARSRIHALLTPEQRELAKKFGPWGQRRHGHRRWR